MRPFRSFLEGITRKIQLSLFAADPKHHAAAALSIVQALADDKHVVNENADLAERSLKASFRSSDGKYVRCRDSIVVIWTK
jgi:hypothetical protein